ncbi:hypothetical protein ACWOUW_004097, partial [Vibrio vulnificus]
LSDINRTLFKKVSKIVLDRHKKSETYKQVSDCLSSEGSVNRSLSDLHCCMSEPFSLFPQKSPVLLVAYFLVIQLTNSVLPVAKRFLSTIL